MNSNERARAQLVVQKGTFFTSLAIFRARLLLADPLTSFITHHHRPLFNILLQPAML